MVRGVRGDTRVNDAERGKGRRRNCHADSCIFRTRCGLPRCYADRRVTNTPDAVDGRREAPLCVPAFPWTLVGGLGCGGSGGERGGLPHRWSEDLPLGNPVLLDTWLNMS